MGKCKRKAIQTDLGTFRHIQELFRHIQVYSKPCVTLDIFRTVVYSEPWHIHKPGIFRTPVFSEPWHIQCPRHIQLTKIVDGYNYFRKL